MALWTRAAASSHSALAKVPYKIEAMQKHGIEIIAWWYPAQNQKILDALKGHGIRRPAARAHAREPLHLAMGIAAIQPLTPEIDDDCDAPLAHAAMQGPM